MKMLAIDFGERRIGLALSDPEGRFALPWKTLERSSDRAAIAAIRELVREENIEALVIGEPLRPADGGETAATRRVRSFGERLARACELPVEWIEETLTSREADRRLRAAGVSAATRRAQSDAVAAQILLEEAIERRRR